MHGEELSSLDIRGLSPPLVLYLMNGSVYMLMARIVFLLWGLYSEQHSHSLVDLLKVLGTRYSSGAPGFQLGHDFPSQVSSSCVEAAGICWGLVPNLWLWG